MERSSRASLLIDVALYGLSAAFAAGTALWSTLPAHRFWGAIALGGYLPAMLISAMLLKRYALPAIVRMWIALGASVAVTLMPLAAEVAQRAAGATGRAQEEVGVIEDSGVRLVKTGSPYLSADRIADLPHQLLGYNPYQPGMAAFGLPRALTGGGLGDARIWFAVAAIACVAGALRILSRAGMPRSVGVRAVQSVGVLPICALTLATGGDDLPVLAACLLALAFASAGRFTGAGIAVGCAAAAKLFAWPVLIVLLVLAIRRGRAARFAPPALAIPLATLAPFVLWHGKALVDNVVSFPLGKGVVDSTAASPFPGYLIAHHLPAGGPIAIGCLVIAAIAVGGYVLARPPETADRAAGLCAAGLLVAIALMPSSRFGYLLYPAVFAVWWWVLKNTAHPNPVWSKKIGETTARA